MDGETIFTIICTVIASSGFWSWISKLGDKTSYQTRMMLGLGHDRIIELGTRYLDRGFCTFDEYENLNDYLYKPYKGLHGNGTGSKVMERVSALPMFNTLEAGYRWLKSQKEDDIYNGY